MVCASRRTGSFGKILLRASCEARLHGLGKPQPGPALAHVAHPLTNSLYKYFFFTGIQVQHMGDVREWPHFPTAATAVLLKLYM